MARNRISTLPTKEQRQAAKLLLASGGRYVPGGNWKPDLGLLPTRYLVDQSVKNPVPPGGFPPGRPFINETAEPIADITTADIPPIIFYKEPKAARVRVQLSIPEPPPLVLLEDDVTDDIEWLFYTDIKIDNAQLHGSGQVIRAVIGEIDSEAAQVTGSAVMFAVYGDMVITDTAHVNGDTIIRRMHAVSDSISSDVAHITGTATMFAVSGDMTAREPATITGTGTVHFMRRARGLLESQSADVSGLAVTFNIDSNVDLDGTAQVNGLGIVHRMHAVTDSIDAANAQVSGLAVTFVINDHIIVQESAQVHSDIAIHRMYSISDSMITSSANTTGSATVPSLSGHLMVHDFATVSGHGVVHTMHTAVGMAPVGTTAITAGCLEFPGVYGAITINDPATVSGSATVHYTYTGSGNMTATELADIVGYGVFVQPVHGDLISQPAHIAGKCYVSGDWFLHISPATITCDLHVIRTHEVDVELSASATEINANLYAYNMPDSMNAWPVGIGSSSLPMM